MIAKNGADINAFNRVLFSSDSLSLKDKKIQISDLTILKTISSL